MSEHMTPNGAQEAADGRESASRPGNEARDVQAATDAPGGRTEPRHPQPRPKGSGMTDQPAPARRGPIDYAREHAAAAEAAKADLRQQYAEALWPLTDWDGDQLNAEAAADAVLAVRDQELEQLRAERDMLRRNFRRALDTAEAATARATSAEAAIARAHRVADLIAAGAPWTASRADTARRIREALGQEQGTCRRCHCPAGIPDCTHCNCCDVPDQPLYRD